LHYLFVSCTISQSYCDLICWCADCHANYWMLTRVTDVFSDFAISQWLWYISCHAMSPFTILL
jgi:hypothetical protein